VWSITIHEDGDWTIGYPDRWEFYVFQYGQIEC
jgi:hypothetical protein